jgi:S1-C subfamily serine protease
MSTVRGASSDANSDSTSGSNPGAAAGTSSAAATALAGFSDALEDAVAAVAPAIVAIHARRRVPASGVVWRTGYVVASDHTIRRESGITVTLEDGRSVDATLVGRDPGTDLALLRLSDETVAAAPRAISATVRAGQIVLAVGRPGRQVTATLGAIHAVGGEWRTWQGGHLSQSIRLDLAVYDGFSGGALVDAHGRVVGVNSSVLARGAPATIPAATVDRVVEQLLKGGRVPRGWLGIGTQPVRIPERVREESALMQDVGLLIIGIATGSPAERAALHVGDTLVALAGTPTRGADDVIAILGADTVGKTLTARLVRAGAIIEVPVEIGESPHSATGGRAESGDTAQASESPPDLHWYGYAFGRGFRRR